MLHIVVTNHCYGIQGAAPKEVDIQHRRAEFAAATWRIIMDEGLSAATMRRIAAEVHCTTGALTHYFTNREPLLVEALRRAHIAAGARLIEAARKASGDLARLEVVLVEALPWTRGERKSGRHGSRYGRPHQTTVL